MKTNKAVAYSAKTHEGGCADAHQRPLLELERAVSTCLLFEDTFYEAGSDLANRIAALCKQVTPNKVATLAVKTRTDLKLRHVPLFLCVQLAKMKAGRLLAETIEAVVQRPDEMSELLALYWRDGRKPLAAQLKKGLARAFRKFTAYHLAKWNRDAAVKLRDVLFLVHAKPKDAEQAALWKQLVDGTLAAPDTWEVALSSGHDKAATWTRLLKEKRLGYMALLMNLRNIAEAGVQQELVEQALRSGAAGSKALPFRFVSAYKHAPMYAQALSDSMEQAVTGELPGKTAIVLDVSGSMDETISRKGTLLRYEAAAALAILVRGMARQCRIFVYSTDCVEVANLRGLGVLDAVRQHVGGGTNTQLAVQSVNAAFPDMERMILLTDEQAHDGLCAPVAKQAYLINVAPYKPGLELGGKWVRINGWSERVVEWIVAHEAGRA